MREPPFGKYSVCLCVRMFVYKFCLDFTCKCLYLLFNMSVPVLFLKVYTLFFLFCFF